MTEEGLNTSITGIEKFEATSTHTNSETRTTIDIRRRCQMVKAKFADEEKLAVTELLALISKLGCNILDDFEMALISAQINASCEPGTMPSEEDDEQHSAERGNSQQSRFPPVLIHY